MFRSTHKMLTSAAFVGASLGATALLSTRRNLRTVPPRAKRVPHVVKIGAVDGESRGEGATNPPVERIDDLYWLRDDEREAPDVLQHLNAENAYVEIRTAGLPVESLYKELLSRLKESDADVPYVHGPYRYYTRTEAGRSYAIHCRAPIEPGSTAGRQPDSGLTAVAVSEAGLSHVEKRAGGASDASMGGGASSGGSLPGEQVLLDENAEAAGHKMLDVACVAPSPDHALLAYAVDTSGYETYEIRLRRVGGPAHGEALGDVITGTNGEVEWGADNATFFYLTMDDQHRPHKLWRHTVGTPQESDVCLATEGDELFWCGMHKALTGDYLVFDSSSKTTSEVSVIQLKDAATGAPLNDAAPVVIAPRRDGVLYEVEHWRDGERSLAVILTNDKGAKNFTLCVAPMATPGPDHWRVVIPHSKEVHITGVEAFAGFWAVYGRRGGYKNVWIVDAADLTAFLAQPRTDALPAPESPDVSGAFVRMTSIPARHDVFVVGGASGNVEFDARTLRFTYGSPVSPSCTCEYRFSSASTSSPPAVPATGMVTGDWAASVTVLKQREVPNCVPADYAAARTFATAADGTNVPISIVWRPSAHGVSHPASGAAANGACPLPKAAPTLLYGYGSYGHAIDMHWSSSVMSLLDRGMVYAVAHVRGGGEMGRHWYEDEGKLLTKKNTFSDFISCGEHLVASGWADAGRLSAMGASAGGLLMGAVANMRPDMWRAIVSQVGFVDVLVTMADPSIPLTVTEWEEWGNPNLNTYRDYIASYSPMENVRPQPYPAMLLTCGLNDSRVAYWEIAKFAQRLREANTGKRDILCKIDMGAGHFSYSDRYQYLREKAFEYAWLMAELGVKV